MTNRHHPATLHRTATRRGFLSLSVDGIGVGGRMGNIYRFAPTREVPEPAEPPPSSPRPPHQVTTQPEERS